MKSELKNSIEFLNNKTKRNSGFIVPENYFFEIEEIVFAKITTSEFKKETGFTIPENYFNTLENNILDSVSTTNKQPKVIDFKTRILKIAPFVAAASIVLFITFQSIFSEKAVPFSLENISEQDIENWMELKSFTNTEIATAIGDDFLDMNDFSFAEFQTETLEDYITTIDTEDLLNDID